MFRIWKLSRVETSEMSWLRYFGAIAVGLATAIGGLALAADVVRYSLAPAEQMILTQRKIHLLIVNLCAPTAS